MKKGVIFLVVALLSTSLVPAANAATTKTIISFNVESTPNAGESLVTFYGQIKPAAKGNVSIESFDGDVWKVTPLKTTASASGAWQIKTVATAIKAQGKYRAKVVVGKKKATSKTADFIVDNSKTFADTNALFITPRDK